MELRDYWRTIRRRWKSVIACLLIALAAAAFLTWQTTPLYSSSARIFVSTSPSDTAAAYQGGLFASERVTSYAEMVGGRQLAERVADTMGGMDPDDLQASVSARVVPETVILEISATDPDPADARDIAQAYAEGLSDLVDDVESVEGKGQPLIKASITDPAQVSDTPVSPQPVRNLGLAAVLGLLVGLGLAVLREMLDTSISSSEDVTEVTQSPVLGHIQSDGNAAKTTPAVALDAVTPWAEAFRVLRTNMQFVDVDSSDKVFVVTSSLPGEGKSTTAINLAVTLAMADQKVALIECDLRRPMIATRLGLDDAVGTTSVLIGKVSLSDALQEYHGTGLQVLSCGPIPPNPSELLQSHALANMLKELRAEYDVVIVDAPPLLPVTDAALLASQTDGALIVLRHGKTTRDQLTHAIERVETVDARVLGVVINMAPAKRKSGAGYGYGYGYGYEQEAPKMSRKDAKRARRVKGDSATA